MFNGSDIPMGVKKNHAANNCKIPSNHQISYDDFNDPILHRTLIYYWKKPDIYIWGNGKAIDFTQWESRFKM